MLTHIFIRARDALSALPNPAVALIGGTIGAIVICLGGNFRIGSWFVSGAQAYAPAMIAGALTALLIRYLLRRA
jgi:hypothetical protein